MPSVTRTPACRVKGCPAPRDPDWHVPICGHGLEGHHHHVTKRSQGGKDGPQVFICPECHHNIDNGEWGNSIDETFEDGKRVTMYRAWDVHNKTVIEQVIGIATKEESGERQVRDAGSGEGVPEGEARGDTATGRPARDAADNRDGGRGSPLGARGGGDASPSLTHEQRVAIARHIKDAKQRSPFFAGDTANLWEEELGEDFWNIYANEFGYTYPSLRNVMRVCKKIPPDQRHDEMSFAHQELLKNTDIETREAWLERSFEEEWPVKRLREELVAEGLLTAKPRVKRWSLEELREKARGWHGQHSFALPSCQSCEGANEFVSYLEEQ